MIRTWNGIYVTAVGGGGLTGDMPSTSAIHSDATVVQAWEVFTVAR